MSIPDFVKPSWSYVYGEVVKLHILWKTHQQLFGKNQRRRDFLGKVVPNFFFFTQQSFLIDIELTISKLGDPAKTKQFSNLTLATLVDELEQHDPQTDLQAKASFSDRMEILVEEFSQNSAEIRKRRNKFYAHLDYDTALKRTPSPLMRATEAELEAALSSLRAVMREIEEYFLESPTAFEAVPQWDGDMLVSVLKRGERYTELERMKTIPYRDWEKSPWSDA